MTIKEALTNYPTIPDQIRMIRESIATLTDGRHETRVTAVIRDMPGGSGVTTNPTMEKALSVDAQLRASVEAALNEITELLTLKASVEAGLKKLNLLERRVVEQKYFLGVQKWADISKLLGYSKDHCKHVHKSAMDILEKRWHEIARISTK